MNDLSVEGLACRRGGRVLFRDVAFSLRAGQILQIEGRNGCGKTTLLRVVCGVSRPTSGTVSWRGEDIRRNHAGYASDLSYIGHSNGIKDELTPMENLAFAAALRGEGNDVSPLQALSRVGLPVECANIPCRKLSAGQRRRVALARLVSETGRLWVLDEPFTALDAAGRHLVQQLLIAHAARGGMVLVTSHQNLVPEGCTMQRLQLG